MQTLVIGYGNTLRGDDGAGYRVAEQVETWNLPEVRSLACPQLTPDLAAEIALCDRVIFVDAALPGALMTVQVKSLALFQATTLETHQSHPDGLLQLTATLYDHLPEAHQVLIPTAEMGFSEQLSALAQAGVATAIAHIQTLVAPASPTFPTV